MTQTNNAQPSIAYFSLEIAINQHIPSYHGGLGILAGDILHSGADLGLNMVGVGLFCQFGNFVQQLDSEGKQVDALPQWRPQDHFSLRSETFSVQLSNRVVKGQIWEYKMVGANGNVVPVFFLDANLPENDVEDRKISELLYSADKTIWLKQQLFFGLGAISALQVLGYPMFDTYHLNESHDIFALLGLRKLLGNWQEVTKKATFTVHTPLPGAHEDLKLERLREHLDDMEMDLLHEAMNSKIQSNPESFNQTKFALLYSKYANGVAKKHEEITSDSYPDFKIHSVTNGIHTNTWVSPFMATIFDKYLSKWRQDPSSALRMVHRIPITEISEAKSKAKEQLFDYVKQISNVELDPSLFTVGFARRMVPYKRAKLILSDFEKLAQISQKHGGLQLIFSGKAHPQDASGKKIVEEIFEYTQKAEEYKESKLKIVYLPNYNMHISSLMVAGVDLWLNTPQQPLEASGTSGMKASLNGVPNFSVLDGWWLEGWIEGVTGWAIGQELIQEKSEEMQLEDLYNKLDNKIMHLYYQDQQKWLEIGKNCIALNGSYFSTYRTVMEYLAEAWCK